MSLLAAILFLALPASSPAAIQTLVLKPISGQVRLTSSWSILTSPPPYLVTV